MKIAILPGDGIGPEIVRASVRVVDAAPPTPATSRIVTVYSVSSQSGSAKRTPTLRPDVSTVKAAAGLTVTATKAKDDWRCVTAIRKYI